MKNTLFSALIGLILSSLIAPNSTQAQAAPLPLGTVTQVVQLSACPSGFFAGMTCFQAEMTCPGTDKIGLTYGSESHTGIPKGTIVLINGGTGKTATGDQNYSEKYLKSGFQLVQMAWNSAWEVTGNKHFNDLKAAACRPATFLAYVAQNINDVDGGMCAQGDSAGSGALAYSLAWYGAANFLDKVELLSGPVFGDIEQGCMVPNAPVSTVCPTGQFGCNGEPWLDSPLYVGGDIIAINRWTGNATCNGASATTAAANETWKAMSIVDGTTNPSFDYPKTAMAGWLCSNVAQQQNNSAAQGQFFYQQFTSASQTSGYSVTRIDNCNGTEGVSEGTTPQGVSGLNAISEDMIAGCVRRH